MESFRRPARLLARGDRFYVYSGRRQAPRIAVVKSAITTGTTTHLVTNNGSFAVPAETKVDLAAP